MIGPSVPQPSPPPPTPSAADPLSELLGLLKPQSYASGGFPIPDDTSIHFPRHTGIKCYAVLSGNLWLALEGVTPVHLQPSDCFVLPRGLPFHLATDLALTPELYTAAFARLGPTSAVPTLGPDTRFLAGGFFGLSGGPARMLLDSLPPIVHLRRESEKAALRWCLDRLREELRDPQPGSTLLTQQLAYMMLIQALRLHLTDTAAATPGWLAALADPHISRAVNAMHAHPSRPWDLDSLAAHLGLSRSVFALRFKTVTGATPIEYLTRWRMFLAANRLRTSTDGLSAIAQSLGYTSDSAFGKAFRRVMGCSPRQYARNASPPSLPA